MDCLDCEDDIFVKLKQIINKLHKKTLYFTKFNKKAKDKIEILFRKKMIITLRFDERSKPPTATYNTFQLDIDANESIDNLKALISIRYTDIDPDTFDLYYKGKFIKGDQKCLYVQETLQTNELEIVLNSRASECCTLI